MVKYYFIRHGESAANAQNVVAGWTDVPLTSQGVQQAHDVAATIRDSGIVFDVMISSPLVRALDTAKIIAETNNYPLSDIMTMSDLREKSSGQLEMHPRQEVYEATEVQMVEYGGESAEQFQTRVGRALDHIRDVTADAGVVLVVAHAGIYKAAVAIARGEHQPTAMYLMDIPKNADLLELPVGVYVDSPSGK